MPEKKSSKIFVLDTNVILHDPNCIYNFQENNIIIPIMVLEELDKFKRGTDQINLNARRFTRILDDIVGDEIFNGGVSLGKGKGKLKVETGKPFSDDIKASFTEDIPDHRILAVADYTCRNSQDHKVILVTKDINLRMKAKSLHIEAEDYKNDKVPDDTILHKGIREINNYSDELITSLYKDGSISINDSKINNTEANEYFILKGSNSNILAHFDPFKQQIVRVEKHQAYGIKPRNAEQTFALDSLLNPEIKLMSITGKAGTGKTLLALAAAINQYERYEQILLARPIVALSNKDLGFLPGDASEKISPYMQPLFDNLGVIKHCFKPRSSEYSKIEELLEEGRLSITPLAYIRGRSLANTFFIIDEAQNLTPHEVKTIITRAGEGTKMVFTGDLYQIDSPYLDTLSNGLAHLSDRMRNQTLFAHINLLKGERSDLSELASDLL